MSTDLYDCVKEGDTIQDGFPLDHRAHIQVVLTDACVCSLQASLDTLGRLVCELDGRLKHAQCDI